ncbi:MAG: hypothetical protein JNM84_19510 [Planctomycetes bacterium]|nr:hypothetical protein [Planctomycetota bacterium]
MHSVFRAALSICLSLFACGAAVAQDRVALKDGTVLEGKVRSVSSDRVLMLTGGSVVELRREKIADIELAPEKEQGAAFGITVEAPAPAPKPKPKVAAPKEAPAVKKKPVVETAATPELVDDEEAKKKKKKGLAIGAIEEEEASGWKTLLQNRLGLDPNQPAKILLYALMAFVIVAIVVGMAARLADLYSRSLQRVAGFSACTVLLIIPQIVWLPSELPILCGALAVDFVIWCALVRAFFHEQLLKSCVLLVGSAFVLLLVALGGEVGRMMLVKGKDQAEANPPAVSAVEKP